MKIKKSIQKISNRINKQVEVSVNINYDNDRCRILINWEPSIGLTDSERHKMQDVAHFKLLEFNQNP